MTENNKKFLKFESKYYDFHRYFILVQENLIEPNDLHIPNDVCFEIVWKSWNKFKYPETVFEDVYQVIIDHILEDSKLLKRLEKADESF